MPLSRVAAACLVKATFYVQEQHLQFCSVWNIQSLTQWRHCHLSLFNIWGINYISFFIQLIWLPVRNVALFWHYWKQRVLETCIWCHIIVTGSLFVCLFSVIIESNLHVVYSFAVTESQIIQFTIKSVFSAVHWRAAIVCFIKTREEFNSSYSLLLLWLFTSFPWHFVYQFMISSLKSLPGD